MRLPKIKFTSPLVLLLITVLAIGSIFALDKFYLHPYVENQAADALLEEARSCNSAIYTSFLKEQFYLEQTCKNWLINVKKPTKTANGKIESFLKEADLDAAIITDKSGRVVRYWPDSIKQPLPADFQVSRDAKRKGFIMLNSKPAFFANHDFTDNVSGKPNEFKWWFFRFLSQENIRKITLFLIDPELKLHFINDRKTAESLPSNVDTPQYSVKEQTGELVVNWPVQDLHGKKIGYFSAELPVQPSRLQAIGARRMILITIILSIGIILAVILGTNIIFIGPVIRLLRRLQKIEPETELSDDLTRGLHGEPKIIADKLLSAMRELAFISKTDQLTGLSNRRHFEEMLEAFYEQALRYKRPLSLITLDIDFFKAVNDAGGHATGDKLLKLISKAITKASRRADLPGRQGGDEFSVLLPETTVDQAKAVASRIQKIVSSKPTNVNGLELNVTLSIGIADLNCGAIHNQDDLFNLADKALYKAKERGRNCIVLASEISQTATDQQNSEPKKGMLQKKLAGLNTQFKDLFLVAIGEIVDMLEQRDRHMADHARKVKYYSRLIGKEMGLPDRLVQRIEIAAMLHDIGMMLLPDTILLSPGNLNEEQKAQMRMHPLLSVQMMQGMEFLEQEIPAVRYHHERFDGKGYPDGLAGPAIPLTARILSIADCFDAITSPRAYRDAMDPKTAVTELQKGAGSQFDPAVITALTSVWNKLGERIIDIPNLQEPSQLQNLVKSAITVKANENKIDGKPVEQHR